jgi:lipopolysaccharide transport system permease protein
MKEFKNTLSQHPVFLIFRYRKMLFRIVMSEIRTRYAGSILGIGWAFLAPIMFMSVYAVVYLFIFKVRIPEMTEFRYVLFIFSGLIPVLMTSEVLSIGVGSVAVNKNVLSNTVFPIELVPVKAVLANQTTMVVGISVILVSLIIGGVLPWTSLLLPVIWIFHLLALVGLIWIISLVNLVFRDMQNIIGILMLILIIASPVAYTPNMIPSGLKLIIYLNPLAYFVMAYQHILVLGVIPSWWILVGIFMITLIFLYVGGNFFIKAKKVLIDYV